MRTAMWLAVALTAVAMAAVSAPGRPRADKPDAPSKVNIAPLKDATDAFVRAVADKVGPDADLTYRTNTFGERCRNGSKPADDIYRALKKKVKSIDWEDGKPKLGENEQFAIEITSTKSGDSFRFAMTLEHRRDLTNPARKLFVIKCSSTTLVETYEVLDQKEVGEIMDVNTKYESRAGTVMIQPAPAEATAPDPKKQSEIDVPNFGTIEIRKRVLVNGKEQTDSRPLKLLPTAVELTAGVKGWRYRCPDLSAETTFEVVLFNNRSHAWAVDVTLDGRSSTEMAGGKFKGAKYIVPAKPKDRDADPCAIKGWLKDPKGETGSDGKQTFEYTDFKVINVPDDDPKLAKITAAARSTIRVTWYGAWPEGTERPGDLPNPQSSGTDIVGGGNHGTMDLKVVKYDIDKRPLGSMVIEFGGRASKKE